VNCPNCGTNNPDTANLCAQCGRPLHAAPPPPPQASYAPPPPPRASFAPAAGGTPPPNYLILSIFTTLCCCLPLGIVGIIFAAQVNSKFAAGDYAGAQTASANAKKWSLIGIVVGLLVQIIWIVFAGGAALLEGISAGMAG
jgi:hypothetical protein